MKFLVDRCAGRRLADWLRDQGHDVREATEVTADPAKRSGPPAVRSGPLAHPGRGQDPM